MRGMASSLQSSRSRGLDVHSFLSPSRVRRPARLHSPSLVGALAAVLLACGGRAGLLDGLAPEADASLEAAAPAVSSTPPPMVPEASPPLASAPEAEASSPPPVSDPCATMPPIPCPGGGYQYCVAGDYSACPMRCGVCVPGSSRVCFIGYCKAWGTQTCGSDGLSFGACQEGSPPSQCASAADSDKASAALEQCCVDAGYCCEDLFDLNGNGSTTDQVGSCSGTSC
jgi:hypothetical protein